MASRIEGKRETSPISSAQVSAVIGPTPGTVLRRLIRSASKGSRCRELTRAYPFSAVARCCLGSPAAEVGYSHSPLRCLRVAHGNTPLCAAAACCGSLLFPSADRRSNRGGCHVAFRQEVAAQAVGDLAGIDAIVLLLGRCDGAQHQGMRYLHLLSMREQVIVDPAGENRCFHGYGPGLRKRLHPAVQFPACCSDLAFLVDLTARILDAVADRLLVNIQSDVIHMSLRSLRGCSLNQRSD